MICKIKIIFKDNTEDLLVFPQCYSDLTLSEAYNEAKYQYPNAKKLIIIK